MTTKVGIMPVAYSVVAKAMLAEDETEGWLRLRAHGPVDHVLVRPTMLEKGLHDEDGECFQFKAVDDNGNTYVVKVSLVGWNNQPGTAVTTYNPPTG